PKSGASARPRTSVVPGAKTGTMFAARTFGVARALRRAGVPAVADQAGRSMKGQFKHAGRLGVAFVAIVGDEGLELKDMDSGEQRPVESEEALVEAVR
ncbi:MAG: His/Gly/Thr/Pro-type tRNA ligase C-terminal domain-containing protein, partial [Actinomycetota bacterium]|nr:His/Gly/Thr/Pro-type tRNA ligase C-terminal domain-containing protein [Actinomycetota bacterium]